MSVPPAQGPAVPDGAYGLFLGVFRQGVNLALAGPRPPRESEVRHRCAELMATRDLRLWPEVNPEDLALFPGVLDSFFSVHARYMQHHGETWDDLYTDPQRFAAFFRTTLQ